MLIDHLSPSGITQYLRCSMQWYYRRTLGPKPPGIFLLAGKSAEHGLNSNFLNKIANGEDLPICDVKELVAAKWDEDRGTTVFFPDDDEGRTKDITIERTGIYRAKIAPKIKATTVQSKFRMTFKDCMPCIEGIKDLEDETRIIDWKTSGKALKEPTVDQSLQMTTYALTRPMGTILELHCINLAKSKEADCLNIIPVKPNFLNLKSLILRVYDGISKDVYIPNRSHYLCSPRFCGYYDECHLENG